MRNLLEPEAIFIAPEPYYNVFITEPVYADVYNAGIELEINKVKPHIVGSQVIVYRFSSKYSYPPNSLTLRGWEDIRRMRQYIEDHPDLGIKELSCKEPEEPQIKIDGSTESNMSDWDRKYSQMLTQR